MENKQSVVPFTGYQKFVIFILAITQFTVILDFMVMSPLGDMLMKSLNLKPSAFGVAVSAYAFSAGISGLLTAGFADKFDRKKLLLFFYIGFIVGTIFCGMAHSYAALVAARIITGLFGGVIGSISMAIITDIFALQQRGRVMVYTNGLWCKPGFRCTYRDLYRYRMAVGSTVLDGGRLKCIHRGSYWFLP